MSDQDNYLDEHYFYRAIGAAFAHDLRSPTNTIYLFVRRFFRSVEEHLVKSSPENLRVLHAELRKTMVHCEVIQKLLSECFDKMKSEERISNDFIAVYFSEKIDREFAELKIEVRSILKKVLRIRSISEFDFLKSAKNKKNWSDLDKAEKRMAALIEGLHVISDFDMKREGIEKCNVYSQLEDVANSYRWRRIKDSFDYEFNTFFLSSKRTQIEAKPEYLKMIFSNIIENALRYAVPNDEVELFFGVREIEFNNLKRTYYNKLKHYNAKGAWVEIHIANRHGTKPIETDRLDKVFDLFHTENKHYDQISGGGGVGLAICRLVCYFLRGIIFINDKRENLTDFTILLPSLYANGISKAQLIQFERIGKHDTKA